MKKIISFIITVLIFFTLAGCSIENDIPEHSSFEVHYIDVGQADCALVICDGDAMLIDGGNVGDSRLVASYLKQQGIDNLEYVVCSHAHEDHVGGLSAALSVANAGAVYAPKTGADTKAYKDFVNKVKKQGLKIKNPKAGERISIGSAGIEFLGPINERGKETNSTSIVLKITYGNTSFLFTGDAERDEEEEILSSGANLKSTVLKVGHHGSSGSTSYPFLRAVMPQYAVISCEKGNSYGHPHKETMSKLYDAETEIYRTDTQGHIVMSSDGENIEIQTEK